MDMGFRFKDFLLNENRAYLAQRSGDILTALQDLDQNSNAIGTKQLVSACEGIVNQIRRILHTHWPKREEYNLKKMQKIAVSLMKAIETKSDLTYVIKGSIQELEGMLGNLKAPVNQLITPEGEDKPAPDKRQSGVGDPIKPSDMPQQSQPITPAPQSPPNNPPMSNNGPMI